MTCRSQLATRRLPAVKEMREVVARGAAARPAAATTTGTAWATRTATTCAHRRARSATGDTRANRIMVGPFVISHVLRASNSGLVDDYFDDNVEIDGSIPGPAIPRQTAPTIARTCTPGTPAQPGRTFLLHGDDTSGIASTAPAASARPRRPVTTASARATTTAAPPAPPAPPIRRPPPARAAPTHPPPRRRTGFSASWPWTAVHSTNVGTVPVVGVVRRGAAAASSRPEANWTARLPSTTSESSRRPRSMATHATMAKNEDDLLQRV